MKFYETTFEEYLANHKLQSLHPQLNDVYKKFPAELDKFKNLIFYGPKGVGKYTQMLAAIKKYSPSELKYEKKISITYNKTTYYFKISDVHFEVDMSLLGCHSKMLWNEIYSQIIDIILAKAENTGIIVCKYFHEIHSELLDSFYSYMQSFNNNAVNLKIILITEELSFIPDNIINCCQVIKVPRPTRALYNRCIKLKTTQTQLCKTQDLSVVSNIKNLYTDMTLMQPHEMICMKILDEILKTNETLFDFLQLRDQLYDIFIYNLDVVECIWFILDNLVKNNCLQTSDFTNVLIKTVTFLQYYNNNYRPIYHVENYIMFLMECVNNAAMKHKKM